MTTYDYDLFTIGAGSGGVRASRMAAQYGARVAIAEEYRIGGTCVIRGCVPKKLFVYASHFGEDMEDAAGFGWQMSQPSFSWETLIRNKDREIDRLNGVYITNLEKAGVAIVNEHAELVDNHTVRLASGRTLTAATILIATGATPFVPADVSGIEHAITSNEAFHLETLPNHIVVVGGGYIAVEFAGIFNGLGVKTTLLYRGDEILRGFDEDLRTGLREEMTKKGIDVRIGSDVEDLKKNKTGVKVTLKGGEVLETGLVMYATGRVPNVQGLGLEAAGVVVDKKGAVQVDGFSKTNVENIYAIGDVTNRANLTPVAIREGVSFAETVFNDNPLTVDHSIIATAVFSQPPLGTVGLTETEARKRYEEVDVYKSRFRPMKHTLSGRDEQTLMKLLVDPKTDRILGVHMMGPDSGELIQAVGIAVTMGATKAQFDATIAVHPTAAEELVTMREKWTG
ncbi:MAG: glutathione-disulfide reductase [Parvularculales bacterium]